MNVTREMVRKAAERVGREIGGTVTHHYAASERQRGPSNFDVIARPSNESHGIYDTLEEARGCVAFDRLTDYEIWQGDHIVEEDCPVERSVAASLATLYDREG